MLRKLHHFLAVVMFVLVSSVALLGFLEAGAFAMGVPNKLLSVPYDKTKSPAVDVSPHNARPIGLGNVAAGGDTLSLSVALDEFPGAVNVYLAATVSSDTTHAYFLNPDGAGFTQIAFDRLLSVYQSGGIEPWKAGTTGPINEALFGDFPVAKLPPGTYNLYLLVTPAGDYSASKFYLWNTSFDSAFTLTVNKFGKGSVKSDLTGISCGETCAGSYPAGKVVTLTAEASTADGYEFRYWTGCDSWAGNTCTVSMDRSKTVSPVFGRPVVPSDNFTSLSELPDDTMKLLVSQSGGTYTFDKSATTLLGLKAGNMFYNTNSKLVRKATKISTASDGQIVIETTEVKLEDIVKDGTLTVLAEHAALDLAATEMAPGFSIRESSTKPGSYVIEALPLESPLLGPIKAAPPTCSDPSDYCDNDHSDALACYSCTLLEGESTSSTGNSSISGKLLLRGYINLDVGVVDYAFDTCFTSPCGAYGQWPLHEFRMIVNLKNENHIELTSEVKGTAKWEQKIGKLVLGYIPIMGPVGVAASIELYIGADAQLKASLHTGMAFVQDLNAGVRFSGDNDKGVEGVWDYNKNLNLYPLILEGENSIKGYLRAQVNLGIVLTSDAVGIGAALKITPYIQATGSIEDTPQRCGLGIDLSAGLDTDLEASANIDTWVWSQIKKLWEGKLAKYEWPLLHEQKDYHFDVKSAVNWKFTSSAGADNITLTFDSPICAWTAKTNAFWITINNPAGYGSSTINYSVSANTAKTGRTGTITINGEDYTVYQAGDGQMNLTVDAQDSTGAQILQGAASSGSDSWRIALNAFVPHVVSDPKGMYCNEFPCTKSFDTGSSVKLTAYNGSSSDLVFTKWTGAPCEGITAETCTVTMNTAVNVAAVYGPKFLSISSTNSGNFLKPYYSFTSTDSAGSVVYVNSNYAWTAVSNDSWITITAGSSGKGNGTVAYSVSENTTGAERTGTITIGDKIFTVTQQGRYVTLNLYINDHLPSGATPGTGAGSVTITPSGKTCNENCTQSFAGSDPQYGVFAYLTAAASANSVFRGWYSPSWDALDGVECRTSSISCRIKMILDSKFDRDITAIFDSCTSSISSTSQTGDAKALSGAQISVTVSSGCAWTAVSNASWITITSGSSGTGSGTVIYSVSANTGASSRAGTITVAGQTFTYTQAGAQYSLTVTVSDADKGGRVISSPSGIFCDALANACSSGAMFNSGTAVRLVAEPAAGFYFSHWSGGGCSSGTGSCTVTMNSDTTVTAAFVTMK